MKISEYNQMMKSLTKPGTPEQKKKMEEKNKRELEQRRINTRKKYGLDTVIYDKNKAEKQLAYKDPVRHVLVSKMMEEGEKAMTPAQLRYIADTTKEQTEFEKTSALDQASKTMVKLQDTYDDDTPVIANGDVTTQKELKKKYREEIKQPKPKPFVAKKPITQHTPINLNLDFSIYANDRVEQVEDPKLKEMEKNFNKILEQKRQEKMINNTRGLRYFAPDYSESHERQNIKLNNIKKEDNNDL
ncbi:hypothetical protein [Candidatus Pelagibacter sp.]|uniref:hypothetical protein n=1 Tax=Candidatus Pelagibacter sp. TaxID=2024849 RepID=UPI003F84B9B6